MTILNQIFYTMNNPTPPEVLGAIVTGLASGIMLGFWLYENNIDTWVKFKNKLKENKKISWIFKK